MNAATGWEHRIVGTGEADPSELRAHPQNWRQHPLHQRQALRELLDRVGWVQQVVINKRTGNLVDGHLRVELATERGERSVPLLYVDLDPDEERLVLASLDPLGALAIPNAESLEALLADLPEIDGDELKGMLTDLLGQFQRDDPSESAEHEPADERDFWPVIRLQVSYDTFRAFTAWWEEQLGEDDDEKVRALVAG